MLKTFDVKGLIRQHRLALSRQRLGQHFLVDGPALSRIAAELPAGPSDKIFEIGAGLGALTEPLLDTGATVYAVERDARFLTVLTDRFKSRDNLQLVRSDILNMDMGSYAMGEEKSLWVVGNLPYSLTGPILEFLLANRRWVRRAVLMIQKEVAERMVAGPGGKECSSLSITTRLAFTPSIVFLIPPTSFYPKPKVTSAVIRLEPLDKPVVPIGEEEKIIRLVRRVFMHRRKTLQNSLLMSDLGFEKEQVVAALAALKIDPIRRCETLSLEEFVGLSRTLKY